MTSGNNFSKSNPDHEHTKSLSCRTTTIAKGLEASALRLEAIPIRVSKHQRDQIKRPWHHIVALPGADIVQESYTVLLPDATSSTSILYRASQCTSVAMMNAVTMCYLVEKLKRVKQNERCGQARQRASALTRTGNCWRVNCGNAKRCLVGFKVVVRCICFG